MTNKQLLELAIKASIRDYQYLADNDNDSGARSIVGKYTTMLHNLENDQPAYTMSMEELHNAVFDTLNSSETMTEEKLSVLINKEHRYLQGRLFRLIRCIIRDWHDCYMQKRFDDRNAFACRQSYIWTENNL